METGMSCSVASCMAHRSAVLLEELHQLYFLRIPADGFFHGHLVRCKRTSRRCIYSTAGVLVLLEHGGMDVRLATDGRRVAEIGRDELAGERDIALRLAGGACGSDVAEDRCGADSTAERAQILRRHLLAEQIAQIAVDREIGRASCREGGYI